MPGLNDWLWSEVWTDDVAAAADYYRSTFGYDVKEQIIAGESHTLLVTGTIPRVGLVKKSDPEIANTWVTFIRVADVDAVVSRAESLGGTVLMAPTPEVRNGNVAIVADPHGAGFVVQEVNL